ncbi:MAG: putative rane protein [Hydrocarboniphaga sp.]|uniref:hypothetical protein n=1 Tax=Hydrocarboniphaga sp. TaxID=2033016 RepID=UPI002613321A|nr:hypothetical protein [Hydrocarboniphaga sp.]MDB5968370.1 putative rane protein [Hydrocarboniphaga sp.]
MDESAKSGLLMFGAWSALLYLAAVLGGWGLVAGFLPATPPTHTAEQISALFQSDYVRIRIGMLIVMFAALIFIPFAAAMTHFIAQVERGAGMLTYTFLLGAAGNMALTFYPAIWWLVAAFRPDRSAELIYLMNDLAWLQFLGGVSLYLAMPLAVTAAALLDRRPEAPFPRWCGYANLWLTVMILPDQMLFFFHSGPFAWNGLFGLWIPVVVFSGFFLLNFYVLRQAIFRARLTSMSLSPLLAAASS